MASLTHAAAPQVAVEGLTASAYAGRRHRRNRTQAPVHHRLVVVVVALRGIARMLIRRFLGGEVADPRRFWARQGVQVVAAIALAMGVLSIWITP